MKVYELSLNASGHDETEESTWYHASRQEARAQALDLLGAEPQREGDEATIDELTIVVGGRASALALLNRSRFVTARRHVERWIWTEAQGVVNLPIPKVILTRQQVPGDRGLLRAIRCFCGLLFSREEGACRGCGTKRQEIKVRGQDP